MRVGTFCSGICAPEVAWRELGWSPVFFSEIDPFARAVEAHHFPHVPQLGDMTKVDGKTLRGAVDVVAAGTPCQSFSVAGLRGSLSDVRGNLCLTFVRLVHDIGSRWVVWENVEGALTTDDNAFGCFLAGLVGGTEPIVPGTPDGRWTRAGVVCGPLRAAAWRVLDAQYVAVAGDSAVPQRRTRVFVVSRDFGDLGELATGEPGRDADRVCGLLAEILFEPESLPRDSAPRREAEPGTAGDVAVGAGGGGGSRGRADGVVNCVDSHMGGGGPDDNAAQAGHLLAVFGGGVSTERGSDAALCAHGRRQDFDVENFIVQEDNQNGVTLRDTAGTLRANAPGHQPCGMLVAHTLRADGFDASEDGTGRGTPLVPVAFNWQSGGDARGLEPRPVTGALTKEQTPAICIPPVAYQCQGSNVGPMGTLRAGNGNEAGGVPFVAIQGTLINRDAGGPCGPGYAEDGVMYTLTKCDRHAVAYGISSDAIDRTGEGDGSAGERAGLGIVADLSPALRARPTNSVAHGWAVRRLTPTECARLMAFPDDWCAIPVRRVAAKSVEKRKAAAIASGKEPPRFKELREGEWWELAADGPQYKAFGNSIVTKVLRWIGERIARADAKTERTPPPADHPAPPAAPPLFSDPHRPTPEAR